MCINNDILLEFTLSTLCDYNKTINLTDCQKKFRTYDRSFIRDQNPILSYKTYLKNLKTITDMMQFTYCHSNLAIYHIWKSKQQFDQQELLTEDFRWKEFTTQFSYTRLLLLTELWYKASKCKDNTSNPLENAYNIPSCLFPLYYSILAEINNLKKGWTLFINKVLDRTYKFFDTFNKSSPEGESAALSTDILPFTTKNIFSFYHELLKHYFPDELYQFAKAAQIHLQRLIENGSDGMKKSFFRDSLRTFSEFYFSCQANNSFFSDIEKDINIAEIGIKQKKKDLSTNNIKRINFYDERYIQFHTKKYEIMKFMENQNYIMQYKKTSLKDLTEKALEDWETLQSQNESL